MSVDDGHYGGELDLNGASNRQRVSYSEVDIYLYLSTGADKLVATALYRDSTGVEGEIASDFPPSGGTEGGNYPSKESVAGPDQIVVCCDGLAEAGWEHHVGLHVRLVGE